MALIVDVTEADTYFETRRSPEPWDAIADSGDVQKTAELTTAQEQLELFYTLDETVEKHKKAIFEQAYFNIKYGEGTEDRLSQRAVGVIEAGLLKEKFNPEAPVSVVICPWAMEALKDVIIKKTGVFFGLVDLGRDENE